MDRTLDFGSNGEGSNPSAVTVLDQQPAVFSVGCFCFSKLIFAIGYGQANTIDKGAVAK